MKAGGLKRLNRAESAEGVQKNIENAGFTPFEEGDLPSLSLMTVFKGRERHSTRRKKAGGIYTKIQSFTRAEGYEDYDFLALSADIRCKRGEDGKRTRPLYCKMYYKKSDN